MGQDNVFDITEPYSVYRCYIPSTRSEFSIEEPSYVHRPAYKEDASKSSGLVSGDSFRRGSTCRVLLCVFLVFSFIAVVVAAITLAVLLSETHRFPRSTIVEKYESNARLLGRDFNYNLLNKSSSDFNKLEEEFCTAIQHMFTTPDSPVLTEFTDCEVVEFLNGSIRVRYRIRLRRKVKEHINTDDKIEEKLREHFKNKINEQGLWNSVKLHPMFVEKFIKVESTTTAVPTTTSEQRKILSTQSSSFATLSTNILLDSKQSTPEYLSTFVQKKIASTVGKEIYSTTFVSVIDDRITTVGRMLTTDKEFIRTGDNFTSIPVLENMNKTLQDVLFEGQPESSTERQLSNELVTVESREIVSATTDSFATNATSLKDFKIATQRSMTKTDAITVNTSLFQPAIGVHNTTEFPILLRPETEPAFMEDETTTQLILEKTSKSLFEVSPEFRTEQELVQKITTAWQITKTSKEIAAKTTEIENVTISDKTRKSVTTTEERAIDSFPSTTYAYLQSSEKSFMSTPSTMKKLTEPGKVDLTRSVAEQKTTTAPMTSTSDTWYESTDFIETAYESTTWLEEDTTPQSTKHVSVSTQHVSLMVDKKTPRIVTDEPSKTISPTIAGGTTHLIIEPKFRNTTNFKTEVNTTEIYATFVPLQRTPDSITKSTSQTTPDKVVNETTPHDVVDKTTLRERVNKTTHANVTASTMSPKSEFITSEEPVEGLTSQFPQLADGVNVTSVDRMKTDEVTEDTLVPPQTTHISFTSSVSSAASLPQVQTTTPQVESGSPQTGKFFTNKMTSSAEIASSSNATNTTDLTNQRFVTTEGHQTTISTTTTTTTKSREFKTPAEPITQTIESYKHISTYTTHSLPSYQTTTDTTRNKLRETVKTTETVSQISEPSEKTSPNTTPSSSEIFKLTVKEGEILDVNVSFASPFTSTQIPLLNVISRAFESFIRPETPKPSTKLTERLLTETTQQTSLQRSESTVSTPFENTSSPIVSGVTDSSPNIVVTHSKGNASVSPFSEDALIRNDTGGPVTHSVSDYYDYDITNESLTNDTLLDLNNFPMLNESHISATEAIETLTKHETTNFTDFVTVYPHINISDVTFSMRSQEPILTGDTNILARTITKEPTKLSSTNEFVRTTMFIPKEVQATMEETFINISRSDIRHVVDKTTQSRINVADPVSLITSTTYKHIQSPARSFQATMTTPLMKAAFGLVNITNTFSENIISKPTSEEVRNGDMVDSVTPKLPNKQISSLIPTEFPHIHNKTEDPTVFTETAEKSVNVTTAYTYSNITENTDVSTESSTFHDVIATENDNVTRERIRLEKETTMHAMSPNLTMSVTLPATLAMHSSITKKNISSVYRIPFSEISTKSNLVGSVTSIDISSTPATKENATEHLKEAIAELKQLGKDFIKNGSLRVGDIADLQTSQTIENESNITSNKTTKSQIEFTKKYISVFDTVKLSVNASLNDSTVIAKTASFRNTTANETIFVTPSFVNNVTMFVNESAIEQHTTGKIFTRKSSIDENVTAISKDISSEGVLRTLSIADGTTLVSIVLATSDKDNATKYLGDVTTESMSTVAEQDTEASMTSADNTTIISIQTDTVIASTRTILEETRRAATDIDHDTFSFVHVTHSAEKTGLIFNNEDIAPGNATFNASTSIAFPDTVTLHENLVGDSSQKDNNTRTNSITFSASTTSIADLDERFIKDYNLTGYDPSETTTFVNTSMKSFTEGRITRPPKKGIEELISTAENLGDNATFVNATAIQNKTEISSNKTLRISADTVQTSSISEAMTTSSEANSNVTSINFIDNESEIVQTTVTLHFMRTIPFVVGTDVRKASEAEKSEQSTTFSDNFTRMPIAYNTARSEINVSSVGELLSSETKSMPLSTPAISADAISTHSSISYSTITSTDVDISESNVLLATKEIPNDTTISSIDSDSLTKIGKSIEFITEISDTMSTVSNINSTATDTDNFSPSNTTTLLTNFSAVTQKAEIDSHIDFEFIDVTTINSTIAHYSNMSLSNDSFNDMNKTILNETQTIFTAIDVFASTTPFERETDGNIVIGLNATTTTVNTAEMINEVSTVEDTINTKGEKLIESNIKSLVQDVTQSMKQSVQTTVTAIGNKEVSNSTAKPFVEANPISKFTDVTLATTLPSQTSRAFTTDLIKSTTQSTKALFKTHKFITKGTSVHTEETTPYYYEDINSTEYFYENYTEFEVFQTYTDSPINVDVNNTKPLNATDIVNKTRHEKSNIGNANTALNLPTSVTKSHDRIVSKVTETVVNENNTKLVSVPAAKTSKKTAESIVHSTLLSESALNNTKLISNSHVNGSHLVSESTTSTSKTVTLLSTNVINPHRVFQGNTSLSFAAPTVNTTQRPLVPLVNTTQLTKESDIVNNSTVFTVKLTTNNEVPVLVDEGLFTNTWLTTEMLP